MEPTELEIIDKPWQKVFLVAFSTLGNVTAAAKVAGVSRQAVYDARTTDADFAVFFERANAEAGEYLEHKAWERATQGVRRYKFHQGNFIRGDDGEPVVERVYSDTLLIVLLKARFPHKYKESFNIEITDPYRELMLATGMDRRQIEEGVRAVALLNAEDAVVDVESEVVVE